MSPCIDRNGFRQAITQDLKECDPGKYIAVVVVKLHDLRKINALYGYDQADDIITAAFESLKNSIKKTSVIFRLSSSTFGLIVKDLRFPHLIQVGTEKILDAVGGPFNIDKQQIRLKSAAGAAVYPDDGTTSDQLFMHAESQLFSGRVRKTNISPSEEQRKVRLTPWQMESDLELALEARQFSLNYQPQLKLENGAIAGFETLLRWQHPVHGLISPDQFIPLAESSGMIIDITEWIIQTALREIRQIKGEDNISVSLNVSAGTLYDPGFPFVLESALTLWETTHEQLVIEVTESVLMENFEAGNKLLSGLRSRGVRISIDDFGTGYSSLAYFKELPADELKIDQSFVRNMINDSRDHSIVETIVGLAHKFDLTVVAEGVEDRATLDALRELGCDIAQGFYISKPLVPEQLKTWSVENGLD